MPEGQTQFVGYGCQQEGSIGLHPSGYHGRPRRGGQVPDDTLVDVRDGSCAKGSMPYCDGEYISLLKINLNCYSRESVGGDAD
jgi:hypothetical protein